MRYMGGVRPEVQIFANVASACEPLPPAMLSQMVQAAPHFADACAVQFVEIAAATRKGKHRDLIRLALAGGGGLVVGALAGALLGKK